MVCRNGACRLLSAASARFASIIRPSGRARHCLPKMKEAPAVAPTLLPDERARYGPLAPLLLVDDRERPLRFFARLEGQRPDLDPRFFGRPGFDDLALLR